MSLKIKNPIVSVTWLKEHLEDKNLIVLDATIPKVGKKPTAIEELNSIKGARFFDIKKVFSDQNATYPNTILAAEDFQEKAQELGINNDSCIVVYDTHGIYSAPRVWWLFKTFGFNNIAVLDGGLPKWKANDFPLENSSEKKYEKGNFISEYKPKRVCVTEDVLEFMNQKEFCIADARAKARFYPTEPEPRPEVRSGHIPNSKNLPYTILQENGQMKSKKELQRLYTEVNPENNKFVFSCGSGVTACILALGLEISGESDYILYDGSWSEWGRRSELPIETE